ncbi:ImmA/IrrE family metallo-endopeptidase [Corynebacterium diphtheriae]|uniref:ImmA/IrrE family metallo-endopeptidase n=1 Tax=Corynebacterium diphtheriae TaxID=1717 RepID=UPI000A1E6E1E|nr:ImmA/IrrE family metallo-endopeptidase [Corynebacterium diphtheriae]OSQ14680.1 ImmA/IrrE family metallo-endopeptidase [Corynebacterium diphtheriae]CAB0542834.1 ImmA/IrrE family metallo-endopeptidase [Corynebacterium diphtheriae]
MTNVEALIDVAQARGYLIRWHRGGPKAAWFPHCNKISIRVGMTDAETLCSLAHELGHAHYGDPPGHHGLQETRADRFAARLLISPVEYAAAEQIYGPHPARIAHELGVTTHLITMWQDCHQRKEAS